MSTWSLHFLDCTFYIFCIEDISETWRKSSTEQPRWIIPPLVPSLNPWSVKGPYIVHCIEEVLGLEVQQWPWFWHFQSWVVQLGDVFRPGNPKRSLRVAPVVTPSHAVIPLRLRWMAMWWLGGPKFHRPILRGKLEVMVEDWHRHILKLSRSDPGTKPDCSDLSELRCRPQNMSRRRETCPVIWRSVHPASLKEAFSSHLSARPRQWAYVIWIVWVHHSQLSPNNPSYLPNNKHCL